MSIIPDAAKASTLKYTKFVIEHYRNYGPDSALCSYLANVTGSDDPSAFVPLSIRLLGSTLHEGFTTIWRQVLIYKVIDALHLVEAIKSEEERTGRLSQNLRRHGEIFERLRGVSGTRDLVLGVSEELAPNAFSSSDSKRALLCVGKQIEAESLFMGAISNSLETLIRSIGTRKEIQHFDEGTVNLWRAGVTVDKRVPLGSAADLTYNRFVGFAAQSATAAYLADGNKGRAPESLRSVEIEFLSEFMSPLQENLDFALLQDNRIVSDYHRVLKRKIATPSIPRIISLFLHLRAVATET